MRYNRSANVDRSGFSGEIQTIYEDYFEDFYDCFTKLNFKAPIVETEIIRVFGSKIQFAMFSDLIMDLAECYRIYIKPHYSIETTLNMMVEIENHVDAYAEREMERQGIKRTDYYFQGFLTVDALYKEDPKKFSAPYY